MRLPRIYKQKCKEKYLSYSEILFPTLYKKNIIQFDKFAQMYHNNKLYSSSKNINKTSIDKKINTKGFEVSKYNNESILEKETPSLFFDITTKNKFFDTRRSGEKSNYNFPNKDDKSKIGFFKSSKPQKNAEEKKMHFSKNFVSKSNNNNEEDDIISNFNIKRNKFYNYLVKTNTFSSSNKFQGENARNNLNNNNTNFNDTNKLLNKNINRNLNFFAKNSFHKLNNENLRLSTETERANSNTIKNSFYYSLKGKMRKLNQGAFSSTNYHTLNNEDLNLHQNKNIIGSFYKGFPTLNNNEIINEEMNLNNTNNTMNINDSSLIRTRYQNEDTNKNSNLHVEKISLDNGNIYSPKRIKDIVLSHLIEKEYAEVEKKNNPLTSLIYNNKEMTEDDFYRNFNILNMNNLNLSQIKSKKNFFIKSPENNNLSVLRNEKFHVFPKVRNNPSVNKENVIDGVYNIVELKTNLKKKKNKFIITNGHFIV